MPTRCDIKNKCDGDPACEGFIGSQACQNTIPGLDDLPSTLESWAGEIRDNVEYSGDPNLQVAAAMCEFAQRLRDGA